VDKAAKVFSKYILTGEGDEYTQLGKHVCNSTCQHDMKVLINGVTKRIQHKKSKKNK